MESDDEVSSRLEQEYREVSHYPSDRRGILQPLLTSIDYCEAAGSPAWSVTQVGSGFRLNVGQVEVLTNRITCWDAKEFDLPKDHWFSDFRVLFSGPEAPALAQSLAKDFRVDVMNYKSVGQLHWCVNVTLCLGVPPSDPEWIKGMRALAAVQGAHEHFVAAAAHTSTGKLRQKSNFARSHCEGLVAYARRECARSASEVRISDLLWNEELTSDIVPGVDADWDSILWFSLTIDGYEVPNQENFRALECVLDLPGRASLTELRTSLFHFQRAWRWNQADAPVGDELLLIKRVVDEIRLRVAGQEFA